MAPIDPSPFTCDCLTLVRADSHPLGHLYGPMESFGFPQYPDVITISLVKIESGATGNCDRTAVVDCKRCSGTGYADTIASIAALIAEANCTARADTQSRPRIESQLRQMINAKQFAIRPPMKRTIVTTHGDMELACLVVFDRDSVHLEPAYVDRTLAFLRREREANGAAVVDERETADATAKTMPPQPPAVVTTREQADALFGKGSQASALVAIGIDAMTDSSRPSASSPMGRLAGVLAMRGDASRAAVAERAIAEIERLRESEKFASTELDRLRALALQNGKELDELRPYRHSPPTNTQFGALDAALDRTARECDFAFDRARQARALLRALREQLGAVEGDVTRWNRYRLEQETRAGAGHPDPAPPVLLTDLQVDE